MYGSNMSVSIRVDEKVLREEPRGTVYLPFGSEYTIRIKNERNVRALAKIFIDGEDVTDGVSLVVPDKYTDSGTLELKRRIRDGNLDAGNAFKFIKRSAAVVKHRGKTQDDGLVRVEWQFEDRRPTYQAIKPVVADDTDFFPPKWPHPSPWKHRRIGGYDPRQRMAKGGSLCGGEGMIFNANAGSLIGASATAHGNSEVNCLSADSADNIGVTAPGSISSQQFQLVDEFALESTTHEIVVHLLGALKSAPVKRALTVKTKLSCTMCGKQIKPHWNLCPICGSGVKLV